MGLHVFLDNVMETTIATTTDVDANPQQELLDVLEDQHAEEGQAQNHKDQHHIHKQEEQGQLLFCDGIGYGVVCGKTCCDQSERDHQLIDWDAHVFELLHFYANFFLVSTIQVKRIS